MSYSLDATRRQLCRWYVALPVCVVLTWVFPYRWLLADLHLWYFLPVWVLLGHVHTSLSHALVTGSWRKGRAFFRGSWLAYGAARSVLHWQMAMLVALAEETVFREFCLWPLRGLSSGLVAVLATSAAFAWAHQVASAPRRGLRSLLDLFLFGILLGALTLWTRSLYPAILVHGWRNYLLRCLLVSKAELRALRAKQG